jgi:signal transduction histidine kinase
MSNSNNLHFRISSALKDIIGKDLITDDYIAVFELVKNSFDAYASRVDIHFNNIYSSNSSITIRDDGKGMSYDDLVDKWLFVAYSAKKEGTEDSTYDYRDRIEIKRAFAGAKGIGRFSCDRLGKILFLSTKKDSNNSKEETLLTDWGLFETDGRKEFIDISIIHETVETENSNFQHGTVLEISELRSKWSREKLLKLKDSLSKLITPEKDFNEVGGGKQSFVINIICEEELENDSKASQEYDVVNGEVKNFIFDTLGLKTTKISSKISKNGEFIFTELFDGGTTIYRIKEANKFPFLKSINYTLYYLNHSAKVTFAKRMGVNSVNYGHVFIYKNGFRVYPYGEPGEDSLGVDQRKSQGYNRFLGTRELIGQIEIDSNEIDLTETTSRGDGLIKSPTYYQLIEGFWEVLRRLEKYVVEVQQWGLSIELSEDTFGVRERITELLARLSGSDSIVDFEVPDNILEILEASQVNSADTLSKNINRLAIEFGDEKLISEAKKISEKLGEIQQARREAETLAIIEQAKAEEANKKLKEQLSENLFLKSINTGEFKEVISLLHHIGIYAGTIDNNLKGISLRLQNNRPLSNDEIYNIIRNVSFEAKKILNIVAFATKANFRLSAEQINTDISDYIREYIQNIIPSIFDREMKVRVIDNTEYSFLMDIKPIEINIVIDNLLNNSKKAKSKNVEVLLYEENENLLVSFKDDGRGVPEEIIERIFDFGFTTTDGSGLGLFHVKQIIDSLKGEVLVSNNENKGVTFTLKFKKK